MRVLILTEEYPPNVQGGLGVHYLELVSALSKKCEVIVISARDNFKTPAKEKHKNIEIIRIWSPNVFPLKHIFYMLGTLVKGYPLKKDIVHICAPFGLAYVCLPKREPIVLKMHTIYEGQKGSFLYTKILFPIGGLVDRFLIHRADVVLTLSNYMSKTLKERYQVPDKKIVVTLNGIDSRKFYPSVKKTVLRKQLGLDKFENIVLFVGRIVERKGPLNLAKAVPGIVREYPTTGFLFVGSGFTEGSSYVKDFLSFINQDKIKDNIQHIEWIDRDELLKYYQVSDIYCHPAVFEPFGNVVAEALSTGLAIVVAPSGGPEEIIGNAGVVLKDNNSSTITNKILELLQRKELVINYQVSALQRSKMLSWDKTASETIATYRDVLHHNDYSS